MAQMCKNMSASGTHECTTSPTLVTDWQYSIPGCIALQSTGVHPTEEGAALRCVAIITAHYGSRLCRPVSYSAYSDWWIDDPIRYSDFNYKTVTRQEGRSYAFTWGTSDGQGGCSDSEWKTGGPTNHYSPMWRSRTVTCQSPWKQYAETLTAFCARPVECPWNCGFGNPIFPASGVKVQLETDYVGAGLKFERRYNSAGHQRYDEFEVEKAIPRFGHFWRHNFSRALWISANASAPGGIGFVWLQRSDMTSYFTAGQITNGVLVLSQRKEQRDRLEAQLDASGSVVQWRYFSPENTMEVYGPSGVPLYLVSANGQTITYDYSQGFAIQTAFGRRLRLLSDGIGRYKALVLPDDSVVTYEYSYPEAQSPLLYTSNLLAAVYPDGWDVRPRAHRHLRRKLRPVRKLWLCGERRCIHGARRRGEQVPVGQHAWADSRPIGAT
jgi:hypothetical protein